MFGSLQNKVLAVLVCMAAMLLLFGIGFAVVPVHLGSAMTAGLGWALPLLFGMFLALAVLLLLESSNDDQDRTVAGEGSRCPTCNNLIISECRLCPHCGRLVEFRKPFAKEGEPSHE